jgi:probable phosphoglycerate mutase
MTQLLLIRHAHNDWVDQRLAGHSPGVALNERGRAEAQALAQRLAAYPLAAVYASPLQRAQETAAALAAPHGLPVRELAGVAEVHFGTWTGRELAALRAEPLWAAVQQRPSLVRFPDGESFPEVQARAVAALEAVCAEHPDAAVAVVSHGDVIKLAVAHYSGLHLDQFQRLAVATAAVSVVRRTAEGARLLLFNDTGTVPPPPEPEQPAAAGAEAAGANGARGG